MVQDPEPRTQLDWGAEALRRQLQPWLPRIAVLVLARCESTNSELLRRTREAADDIEPCLLVAEQQTRGRGRLGRGWVSAAGASLTFSLALPLAPRDWSGLSLAVGLALAEALDPADRAAMFGEVRDADVPVRSIGLKWPNDLWLVDGSGGRKLGGILIETASTGPARICVVGVGLNVLPLPPSVMTPGLEVASLQELDAAASAPGVLARAAVPLVRALLGFEREGFEPLLARYAGRDILRGHEVTTSLEHPGAGVAEGVDASGALVLRAGGERRRIVSGEVSVRRALVQRAP